MAFLFWYNTHMLGRYSPFAMRLILILGFLCLPAWSKTIGIDIDTTGQRVLEFELDPYYTSVDYIFSVNHEPIPKLDPTQEIGTYSYLFFNMLNPQFVLVEVSVNPLPLAGTTLAERNPQAYHKADIQGNPHANAISMVTTGFPEPWAMSYFLGNVVELVSSDSSRKNIGKGYGGAVVSFGNYHIVNNQFIADKWAEGEIKLKGQESSRKRKMSWSFRIGGKLHAHSDIYNVMYFSIKRDRVDLKDPLTWNLKNLILRNSEVEVRADTRIPRKWEAWEYLSKVTVLAGKKWPTHSGDYAFSLSAGLELQLANGYKGDIADQLPSRMWSIILRPNFVF